MNLWTRLLSFIKKPEPATYGVSCDPSVKLKSNPTLPDLSKVKFYRPNRLVGPFEIRRIEVVAEGQNFYVIVYDVEADKEFRISFYWFKRLFEEIEQPEIKLGSHHG